MSPGGWVRTECVAVWVLQCGCCSESVAVSVLQCQFRSVRVALSVLQCKCRSVSVAVSVLQCQCCSVSVAMQVSQYPCCSVSVAVSVLQCLCCSVSVAVYVSQCKYRSTRVAVSVLQCQCCNVSVATSVLQCQCAWYYRVQICITVNNSQRFRLLLQLLCDQSKQLTFQKFLSAPISMVTFLKSHLEKTLRNIIKNSQESNSELTFEKIFHTQVWCEDVRITWNSPKSARCHICYIKWQ